MNIVELSRAELEIIRQLESLKEQASLIKKQSDDIVKGLKDLAQHTDCEFHHKGKLVAEVKIVETSRFDKDRFEKNHPGLMDRYTGVLPVEKLILH